MLHLFRTSTLFLVFLIACTPTPNQEQVTAEDNPLQEMLRRADLLEFETSYDTVPGDPLSHHAAGFAKILCSAVFITGLDFDFAAENIGYFTAPYDERAKFASREVDQENQSVHVTLPNGVVRTAKYFGDQGCICLPEDQDDLNFEPMVIGSALPDPATTPWPMGDATSEVRITSDVDLEMVERALDSAFANPDAMTAAMVITYKGQIIGERYKPGITRDTPLESWSMGKSLTATLMGILIEQGVYELYQKAPIPEWQVGYDPRSEIRIADIMRMSSGLRFRAPQDPDFDPELGYPDHLYVYTSTGDTYEWSA